MTPRSRLSSSTCPELTLRRPAGRTDERSEVTLVASRLVQSVAVLVMSVMSVLPVIAVMSVMSVMSGGGALGV